MRPSRNSKVISAFAINNYYGINATLHLLILCNIFFDQGMYLMLRKIVINYNQQTVI